MTPAVLVQREKRDLALAALAVHLRARQQADSRRYVPHEPTPKQREFLDLPQFEALYGGAARGGKSDALMMAALQHVHVPGYSALLLRKSFVDLMQADGLIPKSHEWLSRTDAVWHGQDRYWTWPNGARLSFGYMDAPFDKYRYQGGQFQFIGFDELTQFREADYLYLFSRLSRPEGMPVPLRARAATNPPHWEPATGAVIGDWVKQRFLVEHSDDRVFVPARVYDNPHVDIPAYIASLSHLDPITRQQLLEGDWDVRPPGAYFRRETFPVVDAVPAGLDWLRFWDLAATASRDAADPDWTAGARLARDDDTGLVYLSDVRRLRGAPQEVEALIRQTAEIDGRETEVYMEQEPGSAGKALIDHYRRRVLPGFSVRELVASTRGSKLALAGPLSAQAGAGNVLLLRGDWIGAFLDECEAFPNGAHDDQVDAAASAYLVATGSAWRARSTKRRAAVGGLDYLTRRTPPCPGCGKPVYLPVGEDSALCRYCGGEVRNGHHASALDPA